MSCAARKFRHFSYERTVFFAPIDDDLVFEHCLEPKPRLQNHRPDLLDLVRFRVRTRPLQIDLLLHAALPEQMMTAADTLLETQAPEQLTQIVKPDGKLRRLLSGTAYA